MSYKLRYEALKHEITLEMPVDIITPGAVDRARERLRSSAYQLGCYDDNAIWTILNSKGEEEKVEFEKHLLPEGRFIMRYRSVLKFIWVTLQLGLIPLVLGGLIYYYLI